MEVDKSFSKERLFALIKLYEIKEGTSRDIANKIGMHIAQFLKLKPWLIERKILVYEGRVQSSYQSVEYYVVNHKAIDSMIFKKWFPVFFEKAHDYLDFDLIEEY